MRIHVKNKLNVNYNIYTDSIFKVLTFFYSLDYIITKNA